MSKPEKKTNRSIKIFSRSTGLLPGIDWQMPLVRNERNENISFRINKKKRWHSWHAQTYLLVVVAVVFVVDLLLNPPPFSSSRLVLKLLLRVFCCCSFFLLYLNCFKYPDLFICFLNLASFLFLYCFVNQNSQVSSKQQKKITTSSSYSIVWFAWVIWFIFFEPFHIHHHGLQFFI